MAFFGMEFSTTDFHNWAAYTLIFIMLTTAGIITAAAILMTFVRTCNTLEKEEEETFEQDYEVENNTTSLIKLLQRDRDFEIVNIQKTLSGGRKIGVCLEGGLDDPTIPGDPGIFVRRVKENSAAENKLFLGDRILSINGVEVARVPLRFAERTIRDTKGMVKFHVKRVPLRQRRINEAYNEYKKDRKNVFTKQQLEEFEDGFSVYDKTAKGYINRSSVVLLVRSLGYNLHEAEIWVYMNELGYTANPKVKLQEFVKLMHLIVTEHESFEDDIELAYSVFADDQGVCLTTDKLKMALDRMHGRNRVKESEVKEILQLAGSDGGKIDINGFKRLVMPTIKMY